MIVGTDCALYLVFMRYAAYFFTIITMINLIIFIPIYLTGKADDSSMYVDPTTKTGQKILIKYISVLAILGESDGKLRTAIFVMMMVFFTLLTFVLMYFYWKKSYEWRNKQHSHDMKFLDSDISMHAIMIKNLRTTLSVEIM